MFLLLYFYLFNVSRTEQRDYISENRNIFDLFWLLTEQYAKKRAQCRLQVGRDMPTEYFPS